VGIILILTLFEGKQKDMLKSTINIQSMGVKTSQHTENLVAMLAYQNQLIKAQ
jgi:hypothetical protein